jgi:hypothetical protein
MSIGDKTASRRWSDFDSCNHSSGDDVTGKMELNEISNLPVSKFAAAKSHLYFRVPEPTLCNLDIYRETIYGFAVGERQTIPTENGQEVTKTGLGRRG